MARFNILDANKYGGQGGGGYFSLKNFVDSAKVRFMMNDFSDLEAYSVHEVQVYGKKRYVDCHSNPNDESVVCPFCRAKMVPMVKVFIPLYNVDEDRMVTWERGKSYIKRLESICNKYAADKPLVSTVFEIEKVLKEDNLAAYEINQLYTGSVLLEDLPSEPQEVYGHLVLQKSAKEMENYLNSGSFESDFKRCS